MSNIVIKGAREHNLKGVNITIPRNKVVCFVGVSGSGKSTIAFDIVAKEGQRQYFESLSAYARRYLQKSNRPSIDDIKGISSTVIISQDRLTRNPRSTVGTVTEVYTYLRLLYSRVGWPPMDSSNYSFNHPDGYCPRCKGLGRAMDVDISKLVNMSQSLNEGAIKYSNWKVGSMYWKIVKASGYFDMDKKLEDYSKEDLIKLLYSKKEALDDSVGNGVIHPTYKGIVTHLLSRGSSAVRKVNEEELKYFSYIDCPLCHGWKLTDKALAVKLNGLNIGQIGNMPIADVLGFVQSVQHANADVIKPRLELQLKHLVNVGVGYLSLNRSTDTLSGGESQRIKMARQLGCDLTETIYVLDEPTAGLHPRDISKVVENLRSLKDNSNTVLVVEHDAQVIKGSDYIIEVGPGGGKKGGEIVAQGNYDDSMLNKDSLTAECLRNGALIGLKESVRTAKGYLPIRNAGRHNLKDIALKIPLGVFVALTGVSGSGKSSLVEEIIRQHKEKIVLVDQRSVGTNQRGCVATYTGIFDVIRKMFAAANNVNPSLFSYNSKGACEECKGLGFMSIDMNFLGDIKIKCSKCDGNRYSEGVLHYKWSNLNIVDFLQTTVEDAVLAFKDKDVKEKLVLLSEVGLGYMELGQSLDTLSGGESQRLKLASRLQSKGDFYILDEPTSGLHFADVAKLLVLLNKLVDNGNTVLVVEHNLSLIANVDWVIDLGPEGGDGGGEVVAEGTPEEIVTIKRSYTGKYLKAALGLQAC